MADALIATDVCKKFVQQTVVQDVSLAVQPGEVLGLIGPNGGGKSTLLLLLAGLLSPSAGTVTLGGVATRDHATRASGTIGLITAEAGLYPLLTGRENLRFFGGLFGLTAQHVDARADDVLARLDAFDALDRPAGALSSGQRQKVSVARALLLRPRVLLLDEPTSNLDPVASHALHAEVRRQADDGAAVVLCTHDLFTADAVCDRVVVMNRTIVGARAFAGPRHAPEPGPLLALYRETIGEQGNVPPRGSG